jgi:Protein of unknown function (DUF4019)
MKRRLFGRWTALASGAALTVALCVAAWADTSPDHATEVSAATQQAAAWLGALDLGRYDLAWNELATVMQTGSSQEQWTNDMRAPWEKLGRVAGRELQRSEFSTTVRGAPTGQYVTATYLSHFSDAAPILETVLLSFEDGRWCVAGYSVSAVPEPTLPPAQEKAPADAKPAS